VIRLGVGTRKDQTKVLGAAEVEGITNHFTQGSGFTRTTIIRSAWHSVASL
jgi:hypothetical protein